MRQYSNLLWDLAAQGFSPNKMPSRYEKEINDCTVPLDFLVEKAPATTGTVQVADITAGIMPGVDRALATARTMPITGVDLHGGEQKNLTVRICEVGPFLALKMRAFYSRQQPKDAFDILYAILHYDKGTDVAIAAFAEEVCLSNPACPDALQTLRKHFSNENAPGPVKASHFVLGTAAPGETADTKFLRTRIRQDMVDVAARLLKESSASVLRGLQ